MTFPTGVNALAVSTTISPVTQTALVAVKAASINDIFCVCDIGWYNSAVPIKMSKMKLPENSWAGL